MPICPICMVEYKQITKQHLDTHKVSVMDFKLMFPNVYLGNYGTNKFHRNRYYKNPNYCKECKSIIEYDKRHNLFCNSSCAASYNNRRRESRLKNIYCLNCGKDITKTRAKKFCSRECQGLYYWKLKVKKMEETGILHERGENYIRNAKRYLIEKRGHKCEICGITEWMGRPVPLVFDHINGNHDDGRVENCRLVCGNCDMQLPTYKSKNLGNGRSWRRKKINK